MQSPNFSTEMWKWKNSTSAKWHAVGSATLGPWPSPKASRLTWLPPGPSPCRSRPAWSKPHTWPWSIPSQYPRWRYWQACSQNLRWVTEWTNVPMGIMKSVSSEPHGFSFFPQCNFFGRRSTQPLYSTKWLQLSSRFKVIGQANCFQLAKTSIPEGIISDLNHFELITQQSSYHLELGVLLQFVLGVPFSWALASWLFSPGFQLLSLLSARPALQTHHCFHQVVEEACSLRMNLAAVQPCAWARHSRHAHWRDHWSQWRNHWSHWRDAHCWDGHGHGPRRAMGWGFLGSIEVAIPMSFPFRGLASHRPRISTRLPLVMSPAATSAWSKQTIAHNAILAIESPGSCRSSAIRQCACSSQRHLESHRARKKSNTLYTYLIIHKSCHIIHNSSHITHHSSHTQLISHNTHLTHTHITKLISYLSHTISYTTHLTHLISYITSHTTHLTHTHHQTYHTHTSSHTSHHTPLISHTHTSQNLSHHTQVISHHTQLIPHTTHLTHNSSHRQCVAGAVRRAAWRRCGADSRCRGRGSLLRGRRSTQSLLQKLGRGLSPAGPRLLCLYTYVFCLSQCVLFLVSYIKPVWPPNPAFHGVCITVHRLQPALFPWLQPVLEPFAMALCSCLVDEPEHIPVVPAGLLQLVQLDPLFLMGRCHTFKKVLGQDGCQWVWLWFVIATSMHYQSMCRYHRRCQGAISVGVWDLKGVWNQGPSANFQK